MRRDMDRVIQPPLVSLLFLFSLFSLLYFGHPLSIIVSLLIVSTQIHAYFKQFDAFWGCFVRCSDSLFSFLWELHCKLSLVASAAQ